MKSAASIFTHLQHYASVCPSFIRPSSAGSLSAFANTMGNVIVTLNRSPSTYRSNFPPCICVSVLAIDRPRPLPSVLLEISPRINRSVSSSAVMFSCYSDTFFRLNTADKSLTSRSAYIRVPSIAYLAALL